MATVLTTPAYGSFLEPSCSPANGLDGRGPFPVILPERTERTQQGARVLSPELFWAGLGVLRVQGVWAESDLPEGSPRGRPALSQRAGPCSLHPQLCPLALGPRLPLKLGEGCLGGGWSPGSTVCLSLEGPPVQPCGSPGSPLGLALP